MRVVSFWSTGAALAFTLGAAAPVLAAPAAAAPAAFALEGFATTAEGGGTRAPGVLRYDHGRIRFELNAPAMAGAGIPFGVVLAQEGGSTMTLLSSQSRQAIRLPASNLGSITGNTSLQRITQFKLAEFGNAMNGSAQAIGREAVAGHPTTCLEQKGREGGVLRTWVADDLKLPLKFTYHQGSQMAWAWTTQRVTVGSSGVAPEAFAVPAGYASIDLETILGPAAGMMNQGQQGLQGLQNGLQQGQQGAQSLQNGLQQLQNMQLPGMGGGDD